MDGIHFVFGTLLWSLNRLSIFSYYVVIGLELRYRMIIYFTNHNNNVMLVLNTVVRELVVSAEMINNTYKHEQNIRGAVGDLPP